MNRTAQWVIERATARVAGRIEFVDETQGDGDVMLRHPESDEIFHFIRLKWGNKDNSDESVSKKIKRDVDWWLERIAKQLKRQRERDMELSPARFGPPNGKHNGDLAAVLPPPNKRKPGRPKKVRTAPESVVKVQSQTVNV